MVRLYTLITEASASSETSVTCHQTAWRHIQRDIYILSHHHRNRNFYRHRNVVTSKVEKTKRRFISQINNRTWSEYFENYVKCIWCITPAYTYCLCSHNVVRLFFEIPFISTSEWVRFQVSCSLLLSPRKPHLNFVYSEAEEGFLRSNTNKIVILFWLA
jgi:hypothetical protein